MDQARQHRRRQRVRHHGAVTNEGNHVVEYRGVDKAGNTGATKTIAFSIIHPINVDGNVTATVPTVLGLTLGGP